MLRERYFDENEQSIAPRPEEIGANAQDKNKSLHYEGSFQSHGWGLRAESTV